MFFTTRAVFLGILFAILPFVVISQDLKKYDKSGITFEYPGDWEMTERAEKDTTQIGLSNGAADSQISIIVLNESIKSKEPLADARKQVVDPWIASLIDRYTTFAKVKIDRSEIKIDVRGQPSDGVKLTFDLDGQQGQVEACWALIEKRLVLLYLVRPDKKADIANPGWASVRQTIRLAAAK